MLLRILKNDLKRKKTMNAILFLFIVLATMFVASGINNVVTVMNGTDYYLDKAGVGDYVIITMGDNAVGALDEMLETEEVIKEYRLEPVVYGAQGDITTEDGKEAECKNTTIYQSIESSAITFFDKENEAITSIEPGHVYVSSNFMDANNLKEGDIICLKHSGVELKLILDGIAKDALLGSDLMGNTRFVISDADMQKLLENETIYNHYQGEICYIDTEDVQAMKAAIADVSNVSFDDPRSTIKMAYVMDMILAFIMLILSVCLIIVSFVVLKFSITFTIAEEFREIGVMKAIGLSNGKIRRLYIVKYLMMAILGAVIGFFASIPFGTLLLDSVSKKMVLGNDNALMINVLGSVLVVCVIVLFAYFCTGKVKKSSPVDAIRSGQTGERYKNKTVLRIQKFPSGNALFMALNDVLSNPKRFLTIIISFGLCTLFVLMLVNTTATLKSDKLIHTFGTKSHLYMTDIAEVMTYMNGGSKEKLQERLEEQVQKLGAEGMPAELCIELIYKYPVTFNGNDYVISCQQGVNTEITEYVYTEGVVPSGKQEIAITPQISEMTGAKIGDIITIHYGEEDVDCMVTAYFQTMNQLGKIIRLHEDAPTDFSFISGAMHYQIDFTDNPTEEEIELRKERIKKLYDNDKIMNATEYCIECTAVADTMESVQFLLLAITLIVVIMVTILMERSFIADEKSQIAILKAIGFKDSAIIKWQVYRFGLVGLMAVVLAAVVSIPMTRLCISPIFGMMGAVDVEYNIDPLQIFLLYPGVVLAMTVLVTWVTALYTRTIKSSDTANIE
ncbi:MAG: FtsX-like permease family protein [Lachnospiraceae bacterium]|nr:FtsX-like permease family protein [Lachnospiraceae bacterium]